MQFQRNFSGMTPFTNTEAPAFKPSNAMPAKRLPGGDCQLQPRPTHQKAPGKVPQGKGSQNRRPTQGTQGTAGKSQRRPQQHHSSNSSKPLSRQQNSTKQQKAAKPSNKRTNDTPAQTQQPGTSSAKSKKDAAPYKYKTELCKSFLAGQPCHFAGKCKFAHGVHELVAPPADDAATAKPQAAPEEEFKHQCSATLAATLAATAQPGVEEPSPEIFCDETCSVGTAACESSDGTGMAEEFDVGEVCVCDKDVAPIERIEEEHAKGCPCDVPLDADLSELAPEKPPSSAPSYSAMLAELEDSQLDVVSWMEFKASSHMNEGRLRRLVCFTEICEGVELAHETPTRAPFREAWPEPGKLDKATQGANQFSLQEKT